MKTKTILIPLIFFIAVGIYLYVQYSIPISQPMSDSKLMALLPELTLHKPKRFSTLEATRGEMGYALFRDPRFSQNNKVSCASCHHPALSFTDQIKVSKGIDTLDRNAPTVVNTRQATKLFWDGRASSLEEQAKIPIEALSEHFFSRTAVAQLLLKNYLILYESAFGAYPESLKKFFKNKSSIFHALPENKEFKYPEEWTSNWKTLSKTLKKDINSVFENFSIAISQYERGLVSYKSSFNRFALRSKAFKSISDALGDNFNDKELTGLKLFTGKAGCIRCHSGSYLSNQEFSNNGLTQNALQKVRTPSLQNIAQTFPYMHDGRYKSLDNVLNHYLKMSAEGHVFISHRQPFRIQLKQKNLPYLKAFLKSLSSPVTDLSSF